MLIRSNIIVIIIFLAMSLVKNLAAQQIISGPFVGAVTDQSARIMVSTKSAVKGLLFVSSDSLNLVNPISFETKFITSEYFVAMIDVKNLVSDTKYFYMVTTGSEQSTIRTFLTFTKEGDIKPFNFTFGSCQSFKSLPPNEKVFETMEKYNPRFFLQCGDWGYPDTTDKYPDKLDFFSTNYNKVIETYRARYTPGQLMKMAEKVPIDYIYDDHDFSNDNASANSTAIYENEFVEVPTPLSKRHSIFAYTEFFPHYPLIDTSKGIYHTIKFGNVEIFMTDNRASRSPNLESVIKKNGVYYFEPPKGHSILGVKQMEWLIEGLKNSKAQWKFIVSGVSFNMGYRKILDAISGNKAVQNINIPGYDASPKSILGATVDTWAGFPEDQDLILKTIKDNNIKNVIFLSSDSHTSAMDDGANSGMPEVMSGNLAQNNSRLAWIMANVRSLPLIGNLITTDLSAWNYGGQGLGNNNYNNAFANLEIFGNDSVRCRLIDENNELISTMVICDGGKPCKTTSVNKKRNVNNLLTIYPNPAKDIITIKIPHEFIAEDAVWTMTDVVGKKLKSDALKSSETKVNTQELPAGLYYILITGSKGTFVKSFSK